MDLKCALDGLLTSGLIFSIEITVGAVWIWVGPYVKTTTPTATVASLEQAIVWLQQYQATIRQSDNPVVIPRGAGVAYAMGV